MPREQWEITDQSEYHFKAAWKIDGQWTWYTASVKSDGCLEFARYFNEPEEWQRGKAEGERYYDQIHFCDLDEEIARLTALRDLARATFAEQEKNNA